MTSVRFGSLWLGVSIVAITLVGACIRFAFIDRDYTHPDEAIAQLVVPHLLKTGDLDTNWVHSQWHQSFDYDADPGKAGQFTNDSQYNFSSYYLALGLAEAVRVMTPLRAMVPNGGESVVGYRAYSALFGSLVLVGTILAARRALGPRLAICVGAWTAIDPLLIQDSHYGRPESFLTLLAVVILCLCESRRLSPWARGSLAGFLFGLAVACKVSFALWLWLPFMAGFAGLDEWRCSGWGNRISRLGLIAANMILGFLVGVPRVLFDFRGYLSGLADLHYVYTHRMGPYSHLSGGRVYDYMGQYLTETMGWGLLLLFVLGLLQALGRSQWRVLFLYFAPVVSALVLSGSQEVFFDRNISHTIPFLLIGAGFGLAAIVEALTGAWLRVGTLAAIAVLAALVPATTTSMLVFEGFSGRYQSRMVASESRLADALNRRLVSAIVVVRIDPSLIRNLARHLKDGPFLILWCDVNEEFTRASLEKIAATFRLSEVAKFPGLFHGYQSPSSLRSYVAPSQRMVLIYGLRENSGNHS